MSSMTFCAVKRGGAASCAASSSTARGGVGLLTYAAAAVTVLILTLIAAAPVAAHVIEIARDGTVVVRAADGQGNATPSGLSPEAAEIVDPSGVPEAALTMIAAPAVPADVDGFFHHAAAAANLSPALLEALVWQESRWRFDAVSPKGALGLTQLMPGTARELLVDPRDRAANLAGGARYLRRMLDLFDGDIEKALAAYNAGPGRVRLARGVPAIAETRAYVTSILNRVSSTSYAGVSR